MTGDMKIVGQEVLDAVTEMARQSPRLRKNHNLHERDESACHRLFNAIEPGSYIRPHRHLHPEKDETFLVVRGSLGIVTFDDAGAVTGTVLLTASDGPIAADVRHGVYHTAVSLEEGTIFFEAKAGPYVALTAEEKAPFAPEEGGAEAGRYLERVAALFK